MEIPKLRAFCLKAPGVRFSALEIALTGVWFFECFFSSRSSCALHSRRTIRLVPLAIGQLHIGLTVVCALYPGFC